MGNATRLFATAAAVLSLPLAGCDAISPGGTGSVGSAQMALVLAPGITLDTISYEIDGPSSFTKRGTIDVTNSTSISADVSPLPAGTGFQISMGATSVDGATSCVGSATFDVIAHQTTSVLVHMLCRQPTMNGSVSFNGALNVCPIIDGLNVNPNEVDVGEPIKLAGLAHDPDSGPSPLTYLWAATPPSAGTFGSTTAPATTFVCAVPGTASLTLTISDGDPTCNDTQTTIVTCAPGPGDGGSGG